MKIAALEFIATIKYNVGEPLPKEAAEISYTPPPSCALIMCIYRPCLR